MANREYSHPREIALSDDGPETVYDFRSAKPGELVVIETNDGKLHTLVKSEAASENTGAMRGWVYEGEAVNLTLFKPNRHGTSFRLPGAVLRVGRGIGINYPERPPEEAIVTRKLGKAAWLAGEAGLGTSVDREPVLV